MELRLNNLLYPIKEHNGAKPRIHKVEGSAANGKSSPQTPLVHHHRYLCLFNYQNNLLYPLLEK